MAIAEPVSDAIFRQLLVPGREIYCVIKMRNTGTMQWFGYRIGAIGDVAGHSPLLGLGCNKFLRTQRLQRGKYESHSSQKIWLRFKEFKKKGISSPFSRNRFFGFSYQW
jgi:hypothetical protein